MSDSEEAMAWEYDRKRGYHRQKSVEGSVENEQGEPVSEAHRIIAALERLEKQQSEIKVALDGLIGYVVEQDRDEVEVKTAPVEKGVWRHCIDNTPCHYYPDGIDWTYDPDGVLYCSHDKQMVCRPRPV